MTRDENGRFVKGHDKIGGRKPKAIEKAYLDIFKATVSKNDWEVIIIKAIDQAKRGDAVARKFIADYMIGAPVQKVDAHITGDMVINWDDNATDHD
jgi:hypothetical protein